MEQKTFVEGCLSKYKWETIPEGQKWHDAHYPVPECLGGTGTVRLWESDHAVQGVLQSEEYQTCCLFGWEKKWLSGEVLQVYSKWKTLFGRENAAKRDPANLRRNGEKARDSGQLDRARSLRDPQKIKENARKNIEKANKYWSTVPPEVMSAARSKAAQVGNSIKWICLSTWHVSNAGPLTVWQRKRGIDTSQRIRLDNFDHP